MAHRKRREILVDFEAADARTLGRIARMTSLRVYRVSVGPASRTRWTFYDNDLRSVTREGLDLAVHRNGGLREAVLVAYDRAGREGFRDRVWSAPVRSPSSGPLRPPEGPFRERLLPLAAGRPLVPVAVASRSSRTLDLLGHRGGRPRVARLELEAWTVRPPDSRGEPARVHGVRLHCMGLTPVAVRELSENLVRDFGVRVTRRSRMERLLSTPQVADPSHLIPRGNVAAGDTLLVAVRRVLSGQLRRLRKHDPGTRAGTDPEELHDMRVATRRMRAAVRTYGPALPRTLHETLAKDLRWLGRRLGSVRDLDVLTERFVELGVDPHFLEHLRRRRAAARERMLPALRSRRYLRLLSNLDALSRGWSVEPLPEAAFHPVGRHVAREARKARDRLVRQGQAAMERPASELLHETRIRAKRLRYLLEFHQQLGGSGARSLIRRLKAIQDHLGAHQDAVVAREEIQAFLGKHGDVLPPEAHASAERCLLRLGNEAASLRRRWKGRWLRLRAALSGPAAEAVMERLEKKNGDAPLGAP